MTAEGRRKVCPLLSLLCGQLADCIKGECAWFDLYEECCGVKSMLKQLYTIAADLGH